MFLFFLILPFIPKKFLGNTKKNIIGFSFFLILLIIISSLPWQCRVRAESIGIFKSDRKYLIEESILEDGLAFPGKGSLLISRIFHNKYSFFGLDFLTRYFSHFDFNYLFIHGDKLKPKYSIPNFGLFYLIEAPFFLLGILNLINQKSPFNFLPLIWLLLGPVPSALTKETPNAVRSLILAPSITIIVAVGIHSTFEYIKKQKNKLVLTLILCLFYLGNFAYGIHQYLVHKFYHQPWYTDFGTKEMVKEATKLSSNYKAVVVSEDPYIFFLFYNKILPSEFLRTAKFSSRDKKQWGRVESFDKFIFNMPFKCPKIGKLNVLYICRGTEIPINSRLLKLIRFKDGTPAFSLIEFYPLSQVPKIRPILPQGLNYMVESDPKNDGLLPESWLTYW